MLPLSAQQFRTHERNLIMSEKTVPIFARSFATDMLRRGFRTFVEEAADRDRDATIGEAVAAYLNAIEATLRDLRSTNGAA